MAAPDDLPVDDGEMSELTLKGDGLDDGPIPADRPRYVVGVGASAGGLEALELFFRKMRPDTGLAFVVVQHLAPDFKSLMDELLRRYTTMDVHRVDDGMVIRPNNIYLIPPKKEMVTSQGRLLLTDRDEALSLPIDIFFRSLAQDYGRRSIGIVLSGTGTDGSRGIRSIREAGGLVLAQSPDRSAFDGMPRSAIATGVVDMIMAPERMPEALVKYMDSARTVTVPEIEEPKSVFGDIMQTVRKRFGVNLNLYKPNTIRRRIERRMVLAHLTSIDDYAKLLSISEEESEELYRDLLIGVTEFFRDPQTWSAFEETALPHLVSRAAKQRELRIWVAGCASGEEAYTVAILLHEALSAANQLVNVKIFATDLHRGALETAGRGFYPASSLAALSETRLRRYFTPEEDGYVVSPEIRRLVVFAQHDVTRDPPFTNLDLITCRNLLIYLSPIAQTKVLSLFHFALSVGGYLVLGPSETLASLEDEFRDVERRNKIYCKKRDIRLLQTRLSEGIDDEVTQGAPARMTLPAAGSMGQRPGDLMKAYDQLLDKFLPPSLLIDRQGRLTHSFGESYLYLRRHRGVATLDVSDIVLPDLSLPVRAAMQRIATEPQDVRFSGLRVTLEDGVERIVSLTASLIAAPPSGPFVLMQIEEPEYIPAPKEGAGTEGIAERDMSEVSSMTEAHVRGLEHELQYMRENLQATVEELETSNEELQATNEELMAANEELQSTNEELHSVNEELYTINSEYESKIKELTQVTTDLDNLLHTTDIGVIFIDAEFRIRKFTPAAAQHFSLLNQDLGRPIAHLHQYINHENFMKDLHDVVETGRVIEAETSVPSGDAYLMRMHPYRDEAGNVTGVVVTFVDIGHLKSTIAELVRAHSAMQDFAYAISHDLQEPLRMVSSYCNLIEKRYGEKLDYDGKDFIRFAVDGAERMKKMITGLLEFSRVESRGAKFEPVQPLVAVRGAVENLGLLIEENKAVIEYGPMPDVKADPSQLRSVFHHLINNALQFRRDDVTPVVSIHAEQEGRFVRFSVDDNGRGIDRNREDWVFQVFRRTTQASGELSENGVGMGLALVKRMVERHGGRVWIQHKKEEGTCIRFTIPADGPAESSTKLVSQDD